MATVVVERLVGLEEGESCVPADLLFKFGRADGRVGGREWVRDVVWEGSEYGIMMGGIREWNGYSSSMFEIMC